MKWEAKLLIVGFGVMALGVLAIILLYANIPGLSQAGDATGALGILIGLLVAIPCLVLTFWLFDKWEPI